MKLATFIVETRNVTNLVKIINDHLKFIPKYADFYIFYGKDTAYLKSFFPKATCIPVPEPFGLQEYNKLLISADFWHEFLEYDRVLTFQSDSMILREGLEEFLAMDYGYIGAPWDFQSMGANAGLCLRDPKLMHKICTENIWDGQMNEDIMFSNILIRDYPERLAPREVCERFSVEACFKLDSLGFHDIYTWLTKKQCDLITKQYEKQRTSKIT